MDGVRSLDRLLEDKDRVNIPIIECAKSSLFNYGIERVSLGVTDGILPGEFMPVLNPVVAAQKASEYAQAMVLSHNFGGSDAPFFPHLALAGRIVSSPLFGVSALL